MDWPVLLFGLKFLLSVCAAYAVGTAATAVVSPKKLVRLRQRKWPRAIVWLHGGALFFGGAVVGFFISMPVTWCIPDNVGWIDSEDGNWTSYRDSIGYLFAFLGGTAAASINPPDPDIEKGRRLVEEQSARCLAAMVRDSPASTPEIGAHCENMIRRYAEGAAKDAESWRDPDAKAYARDYWCHVQDLTNPPSWRR